MAKELRKAIMLRSKLKNILNKDKTHFNWQKYKYFAKLNVKEVTDNKLFSKNVKPYFTDKRF